MLSKSELIQLASENGYDVIFKDKTSFIDVGGGGITISLISGDTWTGIITNNDLNGKIDKQKIWNGFYKQTRESDGLVSESRGTGFKWTKLLFTGSSTNYTKIIQTECTQDNDKDGYSVKLTTNSKEYTSKGTKMPETKYLIYTYYKDAYYNYNTNHPTSDSADPEEFTIIPSNNHKKDYFESNNNRYFTKSYTSKIYVDVSIRNSQNGVNPVNSSEPFFQISPSFRPQFTFKESS